MLSRNDHKHHHDTRFCDDGFSAYSGRQGRFLASLLLLRLSACTFQEPMLLWSTSGLGESLALLRMDRVVEAKLFYRDW